MAGSRDHHVSRRPSPLRILLLCCALGAGAATDQGLTPYKAEDRCTDGKYFNSEYGKCCSMCPPGNYAARRCTLDADTVCLQCTGYTFTEVWNYVKTCHFCSVCDSEMDFEVDTPCSTKHNTKCKCRSGTHCEKTPLNECVHCTQHTKCLPGMEVAEPGSMHSDTRCVPCKEGYYQSETSLEARCRRHTDCLSKGLQDITLGSDISDSVCAEVVVTATPTIKSGEESNYIKLIIIVGTGILLSIALLLMVLLIRTPSVCKEIGKFFRREDRRAELDRLFVAAPIETRNPTHDPTLQGRIVAAGHNVQQYHVVAETEHLLQNTPTVGQGGGPYLQETEHTSPPVGPCPPSTQDVSSEENDTTESLNNTNVGSTNSDGTRFSAGTNSGVQIQANTVTYNGNIYIYQVPTVPLVATGGSVPPAQMIPDPDDIPTAISEQGTFSFVSSSMEEVPLPFCQGPATGWQCITPQQEEGKDMHLATEERLMDSMCSVELDGSLYVDNGSLAEFGQYKRGSPNGKCC